MKNHFQNPPRFNHSAEWAAWANAEVVRETLAAQALVVATQTQLERRAYAAAVDLADAASQWSILDVQAAHDLRDKTDKMEGDTKRVHHLVEDIALAQMATENIIEKQFCRLDSANPIVRPLMEKLTEARITAEKGTRKLVKDVGFVFDDAARRLRDAKNAEAPALFYIDEKQFLLTCTGRADRILATLQEIAKDRLWRDKTTLLEIIALAENAQKNVNALIDALAQRTRYMEEQSLKNSFDRRHEIASVKAAVFEAYAEIAAQALVQVVTVKDLFLAIIDLKANALAVDDVAPAAVVPRQA